MVVECGPCREPLEPPAGTKDCILLPYAPLLFCFSFVINCPKYIIPYFLNKSIPIVHCLVCQECWKATAEHRVCLSLEWGCESQFLSCVEVQSPYFVSIDISRHLRSSYGEKVRICKVVSFVLEAACLEQFTAHHACRSVVIPVTVQWF